MKYNRPHREPSPHVDDESQPADAPPPSRERILDEVGHLVLDKLGRPPYFHRAEAKEVGRDLYRVNVFVMTSDELSVEMRNRRISDSFYVRAVRIDDDLEILEPEIQRKY